MDLSIYIYISIMRYVILECFLCFFFRVFGIYVLMCFFDFWMDFVWIPWGSIFLLVFLVICGDVLWAGILFSVR